MVKSVTVHAPCSTANLGPGFDVFGLALDAFYDEVTVTKKVKGITILSSDDIPLKPEQNTAGLVAKAIIKKEKLRGGVEIKIKKNIPPGFGMGSSAASAAACAVGINKLYNLKLSQNKLVSYAGIGEKASAGSIHYDNVAASILGGFVIVNLNPISVVRIEAPKDLVLCLGVPEIKVPKRKTKVSRSVIPKTVKLSDSITNLSNAVNIVAGFLNKDSNLIGKSVEDVIVEPARKHMIPGFNNVKKNALRAGALGVTISGAGPSVIAFATKKQNLKKISFAMKKGFKSAKVDCDIVICKPSKGARVIKLVK